MKSPISRLVGVRALWAAAFALALSASAAFAALPTVLPVPEQGNYTITKIAARANGQATTPVIPVPAPVILIGSTGLTGVTAAQLEKFLTAAKVSTSTSAYTVTPVSNTTVLATFTGKGKLTVQISGQSVVVTLTSSSVYGYLSPVGLTFVVVGSGTGTINDKSLIINLSFTVTSKIET
jgi:hypothetical protein